MRLKTALMMLMAGAAATQLAAQQPAQPHRGGMRPQAGMMQEMEHMGAMDSMMAPMMQAMASTPEHLLAQKSALHLTSDQEARLTALRDAAKSEHDAAASQAAMHLREMAEALHTASPDTSVVKHHFQAAMGFMQTAHWAMLRSAAQAWPVLTDAQQHQVMAMADSMHMGGMMQHQGEMKHH